MTVDSEEKRTKDWVLYYFNILQLNPKISPEGTEKK